MAGAQHVFTAVCLKSLISRDSNLFSLIDVVEQIAFVAPNGLGVEEDERLTVHLEIISMWTRVDFDEPGVGLSRVEVVAPDEEVLAHWEHPVELSQVMWQRMRYAVDTLPLRKFGRHEVRVFLKDEDEDEWGMPVARYPVMMRFHTEAAADVVD